MDVFFSDEDRRAYLDLLREFGEKHGVRYWGYCLMSNHVHLERRLGRALRRKKPGPAASAKPRLPRPKKAR